MLMLSSIRRWDSERELSKTISYKCTFCHRPTTIAWSPHSVPSLHNLNSIARRTAVDRTQFCPIIRAPSSPSPKGDGAPQFSAHICCGQMAGWIKMPLGMEIGLSPGNFVLDRDPAPLPQCNMSNRSIELWGTLEEGSDGPGPSGSHKFRD